MPVSESMIGFFGSGDSNGGGILLRSSRSIREINNRWSHALDKDEYRGSYGFG